MIGLIIASIAICSIMSIYLIPIFFPYFGMRFDISGFTPLSRLLRNLGIFKSDKKYSQKFKYAMNYAMLQTNNILCKVGGYSKGTKIVFMSQNHSDEIQIFINIRYFPVFYNKVGIIASYLSQAFTSELKQLADQKNPRASKIIDQQQIPPIFDGRIVGFFTKNSMAQYHVFRTDNCTANFWTDMVTFYPYNVLIAQRMGKKVKVKANNKQKKPSIPLNTQNMKGKAKMNLVKNYLPFIWDKYLNGKTDYLRGTYAFWSGNKFVQISGPFGGDRVRDMIISQPDTTTSNSRFNRIDFAKAMYQFIPDRITFDRLVTLTKAINTTFSTTLGDNLTTLSKMFCTGSFMKDYTPKQLDQISYFVFDLVPIDGDKISTKHFMIASKALMNHFASIKQIIKVGDRIRVIVPLNSKLGICKNGKYAKWDPLTTSKVFCLLGYPFKFVKIGATSWENIQSLIGKQVDSIMFNAKYKGSIDLTGILQRLKGKPQKIINKVVKNLKNKGAVIRGTLVYIDEPSFNDITVANKCMRTTIWTQLNKKVKKGVKPFPQDPQQLLDFTNKQYIKID